MERHPSNNHDLKVLNSLLVRRTIYKSGPISRKEVAEVTGLTPSTVTGIVNEMIKKDIVQEVGIGESSGGRRPILLELNPHAVYIFAVRFQKGQVEMGLFNLRGDILNHQSQKLDTDKAEDVVEIIGRTYEWIIENTGIDKNKVYWCGLVSPGLINDGLGMIERSSNLNWRRVPIASMLEKRLGGIPVILENTSKAAAIGELKHGSGRGYSDLIYLNLSVGIGAGIIINRQVYRGVQGFAGEIGHTTFMHTGTHMCSCGRDGCFEAICSIKTILNRIKEEVPDELIEGRGLFKSKLSIHDVVSPSLLDIPEVKIIIKDVASNIGIAVAALLNLLNINLIILGGELSKAGELLLEPIVSKIKERCFDEISENAKVVISNMVTNPQLMGAYVLALDKVLSMEDWEK